MGAPLIFHNWVATALVAGPFLGLALWEGRRFQGDGARRVRDPTYLVLQVAQITGAGLAILAAYRVPGAELPGSPWAWVGLGSLFGSCGAALRAWAIATLGSQFTRAVTLEGPGHVVTAGPYRRLRHPSYTGALLFYLGLGLGLGNAISFVVCPAAAFLGYVVRIRHEERALRRRLGDSYAEYARGTSRLVPGIW